MARQKKLDDAEEVLGLLRYRLRLIRNLVEAQKEEVPQRPRRTSRPVRGGLQRRKLSLKAIGEPLRHLPGLGITADVQAGQGVTQASLLGWVRVSSTARGSSYCRRGDGVSDAS